MPQDDLYWNSVESESDESIKEYQEFPPEKPSYIDPWDLENYAYIREHLDSMELSSDPSYPSVPYNGSSGEFGEAHSTSFLYVPGNRRTSESGRGVYENDQGYADIEEVRNERRWWRNRRGQSNGYGSFDPDEDLYDEKFGDGSVFGIYDKTGRFRKVALPVSVDNSFKTQLDRSISSCEECEDDPYYGTKHDIYSRLDEMPRHSTETLPIYDDISRLRRKPNNFGLTSYGHLKIDYSCNWNNLKKLIKYNH